MRKRLLSIFFLVILLPLVWPLFKSGFFTHHDNLQVMRVFEMKKCLLDFQIPCRWVPDMGYGYGFPLFNYYAPFVYYIGGLLTFVFGYITSVKILFFLTFILSFLGMYLLAREFFGPWGAAISAVFFVYAPYRALDIYVRGALSEIFAISLVPFVFYFVYKLSRRIKPFYFLGLVVFFSFFLLSHNVTIVIFLPFILFWMVLSSLISRGSVFKVLFISFALSFGISSFFIIPAFFEKNLVQIESMTQNELNFRAHFVKVRQLFWDREWSYGASNPQGEDTISFQVGWPHWWFLILSFPFLFLSLTKRKWLNEDFILALFMFFSFFISVFMTHNKSAFIWEKIPILSFVQFPWRFLSLSIFSSSIIAGYFIFSVGKLNKSYSKFASVFFALLAVALNFGYFRPERFFSTNDKEILSGDSFVSFQKGSINDYLPVGAVVPTLPASLPNLPGGVSASNFTKNSNSWSLFVKANREVEIEIPVFDFPKWEVRADNKLLNYKTNDGGLLVLDLPRGEYFVKGTLLNTKIRTVSNWISLFSAFLFFVLFRYEKFFKIFR